jgi:hypothetical protein
MKITGFGVSSVIETENLKTRAEFRKATLNMLMCHVAVEKALGGIDKNSNEKMGMVFGSSLGELEITKDFLVTLAETGIARPFLFQNSLHNATPGFLSLHFGIRGPTATVSTGIDTAEDSLELAREWLNAGLCEKVLVVTAESCPVDLQEIAQSLLPAGVRLGEGAAALCLSNGITRSVNTIGSIERFSSGSPGNPEFFHDCIALENLVKSIGTTDRVVNSKPNGSYSVIHLS